MPGLNADGRPEPDVAVEFAAIMRRAGLAIPPDRLADMLVGYEDIRGRLEILRQPRPPSSEPSNIYSLPRSAMTP
jgi:hypothetical protein